MRRLLSLVLLLVFGLPLVLPALALAQGPDANLPMCCRRNGAHHCAMTMRSDAAPALGFHLSAIPQRCPAYPALITPLRHVDLAHPMSSTAFAQVARPLAIGLRREAAICVAFVDVHRKRGPPSQLL